MQQHDSPDKQSEDEAIERMSVSLTVSGAESVPFILNCSHILRSFIDEKRETIT